MKILMSQLLLQCKSGQCLAAIFSIRCRRMCLPFIIWEESLMLLSAVSFSFLPKDLHFKKWVPFVFGLNSILDASSGLPALSQPFWSLAVFEATLRWKWSSYVLCFVFSLVFQLLLWFCVVTWPIYSASILSRLIHRQPET